MSCAHCVNDCTPSGEHMSWNTFKAAADLTIACGDRLDMGGGEPTINPLFWRFLEYAMSKYDDIVVLTNGKKTRTALALAKLGQAGVIHAGISLDRWHEPIAQQVIEAFRWKKNSYSRIEIRRVDHDLSYAPQRGGRCTWGLNMCPCTETFVDVKGLIHRCGCADAPVIGNVFEAEAFMSMSDRPKAGYCWKGLINPNNKSVNAKSIAGKG